MGLLEIVLENVLLEKAFSDSIRSGFLVPFQKSRFLITFSNSIRSGLRPTLMHTKNVYENGPNPFFSGFFNLMGTRMVQIRMAKSV